MNALSALERDVLAAIDLHWQLDLLSRLVAERSDEGRESGAQGVMADALDDVGAEVDRWVIDLESLRQDPAHSEEIRRQEAHGVVGYLGSGAGPTLALNGHVDVVGPGDARAWSRPAWELTVADGRAWGRGVVDMKGALTCAVAAARAIRAAGVELAGRLAIHSVVGEEDGGTGTLALLRRGHTADAAVVLEPTRLAVVPLHCGALCFRIQVAGRSAHGCMREDGVSAIDKVGVVLAALNGLERRRNRRLSEPLLAHLDNPLPISVGRLRAGEWPSSVADSAVLEGRFGVAPDETVEAARTELEAALAAAADGDAWLREHPPRVEWWGGRFEPAGIDPAAPLVTDLREAAGAVLGARPPVLGVTYGSDMRLLVNEGAIPTVMFGPGDVRDAHAPDESVALVDLEACTRVLAVFALRVCGLR